jgi:hypothetical protein
MMTARTNVATAAVTALFLVGVPGAHALKPRFTEIYQSTTVTTASDTTLDTIYTCDTGWTLYSGDCYFLTASQSYTAAVAECTSLTATPFTPESDSENDLLFSLLLSSSTVWVGIAGSPTSEWLKSDGSVPVYYRWQSAAAVASNGLCLEAVQLTSFWNANWCFLSNRMVCTKAGSSGGGGGSSGGIGNAEPPASVNGAGGSLVVPVGGEIALYYQFLNPSTGVENAYQFPKLKFVEAEEAIHRAGLVSLPMSSLISSFLICARQLLKEARSPISMLLPTPPLRKGKCITCKENTAPGRHNKS